VRPAFHSTLVSIALALGLPALVGCGQIRDPQRGASALIVDPFGVAADVSVVHAAPNACPAGMALVKGAFCIDRYEASLVELMPDGSEQPFAANDAPEKRRVRAVSAAGVTPQAYVSGREAKSACAAAGKRLCAEREWRTACKGQRRTQYPYGEVRESGKCNDHGRNPRQALGMQSSSWLTMNNPALNRVPGTIAKAGEHADCVTADGVYDMVGNVHEWTADERGTFVGGYYLDTTMNGEGCDYRTTDHNFDYHDYSTGFRCCKDLELDGQ
jgi:formylglycine-generating enzyme